MENWTCYCLRERERGRESERETEREKERLRERQHHNHCPVTNFNGENHQEGVAGWAGINFKRFKDTSGPVKSNQNFLNLFHTMHMWQLGKLGNQRIWIQRFFVCVILILATVTCVINGLLKWVCKCVIDCYS